MSDRLPPGPRWPRAVQGMAFWTRPLAFIERCRARYGTPFTIRLPGSAPPFVMVADPAAIKQIFTAPADVLHPGAGARVLEPIVGANSVILLDEAAHMEQRKLMLPAFHGERMAGLEGLVAEVTEREIAAWPRGHAIELHPLLQALTLEVILRAVFGLDPGPRLDRLRELMRELLAFGDSPISLIPVPPGTLAFRVVSAAGPVAKFLRLQAEADSLLYAEIEERRGVGGSDVLTMLLEARREDGSPMSRQEIRDELMTLLVAGHETTASSLAWAFEQLPGHPGVVERLRSGDEAYVTATIQETLRRRPVLPNNAPRLVNKPIEVGGFEYQPGVCLVPNAYLVHHDPAIYPDPYAFRPERFLEQPPGTYTWLPFGGGRRRCLGASFAQMEMRIVLPAVLATCDLASDGFEVPRRRNITIRPGGGTRTVLRDREPARAAAAA